MGETWGISGPAFLLFYVVLAVVVLIASIRARRAVTRMGGAEPATAIRTRPHDVAYLNGGAELALVSALTALRLRGSIWSERGNAQAGCPRSDAGHDELERAVHAAVATPIHRKWIANNHWVADALAATERRLVDAGLLLSEAAPAADPRHRLVDARRGRAGAGAAARGHRERASRSGGWSKRSSPSRSSRWSCWPRHRGARSAATARSRHYATRTTRSRRRNVPTGRCTGRSGGHAGDRPLRDVGGVGVGPGDRGRARGAADERRVVVTGGRAGRAGARAARRAGAAAAAGVAAAAVAAGAAADVEHPRSSVGAGGRWRSRDPVASVRGPGVTGGGSTAAWGAPPARATGRRRPGGSTTARHPGAVRWRR